MLVDNSALVDIQLDQPDTDLSEYLNTDLFLNGPSSPSSRASSPQSPFQSLLTPPQSQTLASFPDIYESPSSSSSTGLFNFLEDDAKSADPQPASSGAYDFFGTFSARTALDLEPAFSMGIDPQLVGTPSSHLSPAPIDEDLVVEQLPPKQEEPPQQKITLTIAPIKVAGHGKARKGTVQGGGVVKKTAAAPQLPPAPAPIQVLPTTTNTPSPPKDKDFDDDDDLPADWRPPPEVFAKMSSKEKRQLRNKISARNFRVRRKEYISTLELDIAERDRLLQAIRSELGTSQSENQALRQEIAALKRALLEGRPASELTADDIPVLNLPPPGPLPTTAPTTAPRTSSPTPSLLTPNTQKDGSFWGGVRMGGGITPVHTVLMPDPSLAKASLQENINPALNAESRVKTPALDRLSGFDGFADTNPFTLKNIDSYRLQLWSKMGTQQQPQFPPSPPSSTPSSPRTSDPKFSPSPFTKPYFSGSSNGYSSYPNSLAPFMGPKFFQRPTSSASLSGKHHPTTPPLSPTFMARPTSSLSDEQQMFIAALASQTLLQKLSGAFWEAFSGSSSFAAGMDADKVRRVLEGKATVQVVDIEERKEMGPMTRSTPVTTSDTKETCAMTALLEESMKSLTLGKK